MDPKPLKSMRQAFFLVFQWPVNSELLQFSCIASKPWCYQAHVFEICIISRTVSNEMSERVLVVYVESSLILMGYINITLESTRFEWPMHSLWSGTLDSFLVAIQQLWLELWASHWYLHWRLLGHLCSQSIGNCSILGGKDMSLQNRYQQLHFHCRLLGEFLGSP